MRVLGVDPGLTRCGLGVVDALPGRRVRLVEVGVARSARRRGPGGAARGDRRVVEEWLDRHAPDAVAVERVFAQHNVRTVMGTAQVSGVVMAAAARRGIPVTLHTPSEVKAAVTGQRQGGQGAGDLDGHAHPGPGGAPHPGGCRRCAGPGDLPPVAPGGRGLGGRAGAAARPRRAGRSAQQAWAAAEAAARRSGA